MNTSLEISTRAIAMQELLNQKLTAVAQRTLLQSKKEMVRVVSKKNFKPSVSEWISLFNMIDFKNEEE